MLYSKLFGRTKKTVSEKFESKNHELLTKAGFIDQVASGIYNFLPLGKIVLSKIENIVREEMNNIGAQEVLMPLLIPSNNWKQTDRWDVDILFKTKSRFDQEYGLGFSHEEIVVPLAKKFINSYKDLPLYLYHITPKLRDEARPKSGILRGREFGMKDLYSFHPDREDLEKFYKVAINAYLTIFKRCGFDDVKITEASGGTFTKKHSHEFNILTSAGEVNLFYCDQCDFAQNAEVANVKRGDKCPSCKKGEIKEGKAVEVGNIFDLETKFSDSFELTYVDKNGKKNKVVMGCYGIGTTRTMGAIVEIHNDDNGIIWPDSVAPFKVHLVGLNLDGEVMRKKAQKVYEELNKSGVEVLYDDRVDIGAGEKLSDADLIGIPIRLIVSKKTEDKVEYKERVSDKIELLSQVEVLNRVK